MVEMGVSHMTLLIVTLAFSLVNICLIIATGGIIYNWQDRFVGPVMKCEQPKWTSDGRTQPNKYAFSYGWSNWGNRGNQGVNTGATWGNVGTVGTVGTVGSVGAINNMMATGFGGVDTANVGTVGTGSWDNTNWGSASVNTNTNTGYASTMTGTTMTGAASQWIVGSAQWASWKDGSWSTCPVLVFPRWASWNRPTQTTTWNTWNVQPTAWVAWTAPAPGFIVNTNTNNNNNNNNVFGK